MLCDSWCSDLVLELASRQSQSLGGETSDVWFAAPSAGPSLVKYRRTEVLYRVTSMFLFFHQSRMIACKVMGLHMDDIHTPSVASGPTSGPGPDTGVETDKLSLMDLINEKTRVEEELSALGSVLDSVHFSLATLQSMHIEADSHSARCQHEYNPNHLRRLPQR